MKELIRLIQESNIFPELRPAPPRKPTDETRLKAARERAKKWNAAHPERKRANDRKWSKQHGAAAVRRYRKRKKENPV